MTHFPASMRAKVWSRRNLALFAGVRESTTLNTAAVSSSCGETEDMVDAEREAMMGTHKFDRYLLQLEFPAAVSTKGAVCAGIVRTKAPVQVGPYREWVAVASRVLASAECIMWRRYDSSVHMLLAVVGVRERNKQSRRGCSPCRRDLPD